MKGNKTIELVFLLGAIITLAIVFVLVTDQMSTFRELFNQFHQRRIIRM